MSSWLPSIFKSKPKTSYKYETQADLDKLTANEILNLNPNEVSLTVDKNTGGVNLPGDKRAAMFRLLSIKREEERNPSLSSRRASVVDKLTNRDKEVEELMRDTQDEIDAENTTRNRLTLLDNPQVPTSKKGGRTRRRRGTRAKRAIKRSYKRSNKRTQRTRRR
jgi:hypothetical protein